MTLITSEALVLRTYKLGETSKIVVLLTRDRGKVRAVAKGARGGKPRYGSALEPLSEVRVTLHGRQGADLFRLGQCDLVRSAFPSTGRDLDLALAMSYFAELLDARPVANYEIEHIPGAVPLPEDDFDRHFAILEPRLRSSFDNVVYCAGYGCEASHLVAERLKARGIQVAILNEGWPAWTDAGYPVKEGAEP